MKRIFFSLMAMCLLAMSLAAVAQSGDSMKQGDQMKHDNMGKAVTVTGKISGDGKSFTTDTDNKTWTIINPDAVKGHEGHHVTIKGHANAGKGELHVVSLKMAKADNMK
jgi:pentapeptide MXKDX repeat protein